MSPLAVRPRVVTTAFYGHSPGAVRPRVTGGRPTVILLSGTSASHHGGVSRRRPSGTSASRYGGVAAVVDVLVAWYAAALQRYVRESLRWRVRLRTTFVEWYAHVLRGIGRTSRSFISIAGCPGCQPFALAVHPRIVTTAPVWSSAHVGRSSSGHSGPLDWTRIGLRFGGLLYPSRPTAGCRPLPVFTHLLD